MKIKYSLLFFLSILIAFSGCKSKDTSADPKIQLAADEAIIKDFLVKNNITAIRHESGVYYQIITPGNSGSINSNSSLTTNYTGRLLDGTVFDTTTGKQPFTFSLGSVIDGWRIGVPLIQKGGKIRLFIPSLYAYKTASSDPIPANSVLDFDIEILP